jgi:hypothetical protein
LEDSWNTKRDAEVVTRFQLSHYVSAIRKHDNCLLFEVGGKDNLIFRFDFQINGLIDISISKGVFSKKPETCRGWSFPAYGKCLPAFTVDFIQKNSESFLNKFQLSYFKGK